MRYRSLDPAPRQYSADVSLIRRSARGPAAAPLRTSPDEIEEWLLDGAMREHDMLALFEELAWRLAAASLPVDRLSLHIGTLHPQIIGFGWNWSRDDGLCDEIKVGEGALDSDAYRLSPLARCIEHGERFRADPRDAALQARFPFLAELAGHGFTEYAALPLGGDGYHNVMTVATKAPGGVTEADLQALMGLRKIFALHVQRHIALRIAGNVLGTYLGAAAGARVLDGSIRRGSGEAISAVIMVSDLRGFTDLSGRLAGPDMIALLNAYFERMAGAVLAEGGEVLKFIGDGLLAAFPFAAFAEPAAAASRCAGRGAQGARRRRGAQRSARAARRHCRLAAAARRHRPARRRGLLRQYRRRGAARLHGHRPRRQRGQPRRGPVQAARPPAAHDRRGGEPSRRRGRAPRRASRERGGRAARRLRAALVAARDRVLPPAVIPGRAQREPGTYPSHPVVGSGLSLKRAPE